MNARVLNVEAWNRLFAWTRLAEGSENIAKDHGLKRSWIRVLQICHMGFVKRLCRPSYVSSCKLRVFFAFQMRPLSNLSDTWALFLGPAINFSNVYRAKATFSATASQNTPANTINAFLKIFRLERDRWERSFPFDSDMFTQIDHWWYWVPVMLYVMLPCCRGDAAARDYAYTVYYYIWFLFPAHRELFNIS